MASWLRLLASNTTNKKCQTKQLWVVLCGKCFGAKINFYKYKQNPFLLSLCTLCKQRFWKASLKRTQKKLNKVVIFRQNLVTLLSKLCQKFVKICNHFFNFLFKEPRLFPNILIWNSVGCCKTLLAACSEFPDDPCVSNWSNRHFKDKK